MTDQPTNDNLLAQLVGQAASTNNPYEGIATSSPIEKVQDTTQINSLLKSINEKLGGEADTTEPEPEPAQPPVMPQAADAASLNIIQPPQMDPNLLANLTSSSPEAPPASAGYTENTFIPQEPQRLIDTGLTESEVEALLLKYLIARGDATGRDMSDQIKLPFVMVDEILRALKLEQLVVHRSSAPMNDYVYQLSDFGRERARRYTEHCTYFGSAPVSLKDYIESVSQQSLQNQHPSDEQLRGAFSDLLMGDKMLEHLGPAINSGRGLFLYGAPGNGKTSIAERVTSAFGPHLWVPRAIGIDGEIIRIFDPVQHEELPLEKNDGLIDQSKIDRRWVRIRRPTIIAAGELTMAMLEVTINTATGICEAPLQLKSNCGTLVIDDFGRQRMEIDELLNRWILPLEKRYDFLNLPSGKKIQVPFDQLIIFSTNLEPRDLVDEAFLRRIPYKLEVIDPTEEEFRQIFRMMAPRLGIQYDETAVTYLIEEHYHKAGRMFRCCHPRDLLMQVKSFCAYKKQPMELLPEYFDIAVENYFSVM